MPLVLIIFLIIFGIFFIFGIFVILYNIKTGRLTWRRLIFGRQGLIVVSNTQVTVGSMTPGTVVNGQLAVNVTDGRQSGVPYRTNNASFSPATYEGANIRNF